MRKKTSPSHCTKALSKQTLNSDQISAMLKMRASLLSIGNNINSSKWTREHAVGILAIITKGVRTLTDEVIDRDSSDTYILTHITTTTLEGLATALKDLSNGIVDRRLRSAGYGGNSYSSADKQTVRMALDFVDMHRDDKKCTYSQAQRSVAALFAKSKIKVRDKQITAKNLQGWKQYPLGVKRRSQ